MWLVGVADAGLVSISMGMAGQSSDRLVVPEREFEPKRADVKTFEIDLALAE